MTLRKKNFYNSVRYKYEKKLEKRKNCGSKNRFEKISNKIIELLENNSVIGFYLDKECLLKYCL